jgi:hypothetical protein
LQRNEDDHNRQDDHDGAGHHQLGVLHVLASEIRQRHRQCVDRR